MKTITIEVPEDIDEAEIKKLVKEFLEKKKLIRRLYELISDEDLKRIEMEMKSFRRSFRFE